MKRKVKQSMFRIFTFFLCIAMLPSASFASNSGSCGSDLAWLLSSAGVLTVQGTGEMQTYPMPQDSPWYTARMRVQRAEFRNGITTIGDWAFENYLYLTSAALPDSLTGIGAFAFSGCTKLREISIPGRVQYIEAFAFSRCGGLQTAELPDSLTSLGSYSFSDCSGLQTVSLGAGLSHVAEGTFCGCENLTSVRIPGSITEIGEFAFCGCDRLTEIYFEGTPEAWAEMEVGDYNQALGQAQIYFYQR